MNSLQEIYTQVYKNLVMNSITGMNNRKYIHKYIKTCNEQFTGNIYTSI